MSKINVLLKSLVDQALGDSKQHQEITTRIIVQNATIKTENLR